MSWTESGKTVFGNKRVVYGTASGNAVQYTSLDTIDTVSLTPVITEAGVSGAFTIIKSASGAFTLDAPADIAFDGLVIGN